MPQSRSEFLMKQRLARINKEIADHGDRGEGVKPLLQEVAVKETQRENMTEISPIWPLQNCPET